MKILVAVVSTAFGILLGSFILPLSKKEPDYYLELKEKEVILFNPSTGDSIHTTLNSLSESLLEDNL